MLKNYLTVAVRNILRHKVYSFINIMGLAVGMVCCILILLWVQDEMSYDRFHENEELAEKYFGDEDSLGKTITLNHKYDFEVTGVLEDIPQNSSIKPNLLIPFIFGREVGWTVDRWNNSFIQTFVQLKDDIPYQDVVQKISEYLHNKPTIGKRLTKDGKQYKNEKIFLLTTDN